MPDEPREYASGGFIPSGTIKVNSENPADDPAFYCHGQQCIESGCSPLFCADDQFYADEGDDE